MTSSSSSRDTRGVTVHGTTGTDFEAVQDSIVLSAVCRAIVRCNGWWANTRAIRTDCSLDSESVDRALSRLVRDRKVVRDYNEDGRIFRLPTHDEVRAFRTFALALRVSGPPMPDKIPVYASGLTPTQVDLLCSIGWVDHETYAGCAEPMLSLR